MTVVQSIAAEADRAPAVISCRALRKVYRMGEVDVRALDGVDFELREGELLVLLGPSGTLLPELIQRL